MAIIQQGNLVTQRKGCRAGNDIRFLLAQFDSAACPSLAVALAYGHHLSLDVATHAH